jgi:hypothetical protein
MKKEEEYEEEEEEEEITLPPIKAKTCSFQYFDLAKNARKMLCNSTVLYGESGDGKSCITNTLLHAISPYVNILFAFCPTARVDKSFLMTDYTSSLFVYETLDMDKIKLIMNHCKNHAAMLREIDDVELLSESVKKFILPLYKSLGEESLYNKTLRGYRKICKMQKKFDYENSNKFERDKFNRDLVRYYKVLMYICKKFMYKKQIKVPAKYKDYATPVLFHDIKPNNVIITNDFGDTLGVLKKNDAAVATEMVIKERHYNITTIHLLQGVNQIKKADRVQIKVNIFLSPTSITNYINTLQLKGQTKKHLEEASEYILLADRGRTSRKYPAVIYFKLEEKIFYTYADAKLDACKIGNEKLYELLEDYVVDSSETNPLANIFNSS